MIMNHNDKKVSGIFVRRLRQNRSLYNTSHMFAVTLDKTLHFLPAEYVMGPAILIKINSILCAVRLSNYWEAD